jgi:hypothetical protein
MWSNDSFYNCRRSKSRYVELLNTKLHSSKQGNLTVKQYCNKIEFIIEQLNKFQLCKNLNRVLLYRFVAGLNCRLRLIIQKEKPITYPQAKHIALVFE